MSPVAMIFRAIASFGRGLPPIVAAFVLSTAIGGSSFAQEQSAPALSTEQLDELLAPISLYPDNLLGQVLTASTYPLEVVMAARWSAANPNVTGAQLEDAMQGQSWDPSVKALTAVPQTLQMMNDKLDWTKQLGEAYLAQPDDVARTVQRLRARADASGNLKTSSQLNVKRIPPPPPAVVGAAPEPEYIAIEPVDPDVIYVPVYDPWVVYGVWPYPAYRPFYWYPPGFVAVGVFGFGAPIVVGAALWANYNWYSRRVEVNVTRFNTFNRVTLANTAANRTWQHDPVHRGNIAYGNPALQRQFGNANRGANVRTNQQFLNTKGATGGAAGKVGATGGAAAGKAGPGASGKNLNTNLNSGAKGNQKNGNAGANRNARVNTGNPTGTNNGNINRNINTERNINRNANAGRNAGINRPVGGPGGNRPVGGPAGNRPVGGPPGGGGMGGGAGAAMGGERGGMGMGNFR